MSEDDELVRLMEREAAAMHAGDFADPGIRAAADICAAVLRKAAATITRLLAEKAELLKRVKDDDCRRVEGDEYDQWHS